MQDYQFWVLTGVIVLGFIFTVRQLNTLNKRMYALETRLSVVETILAMMGMPIKEKK